MARNDDFNAAFDRLRQEFSHKSKRDCLAIWVRYTFMVSAKALAFDARVAFYQLSGNGIPIVYRVPRYRPQISKSLSAADLLILDDWGLETLNPQARHDLLEILEDRYARKSTLVTSQVPVADWHAIIGNATYADAILDRLVHNAHRLDLTGDSMRRAKSAKEA